MSLKSQKSTHSLRRRPRFEDTATGGSRSACPTILSAEKEVVSRRQTLHSASRALRPEASADPVDVNGELAMASGDLCPRIRGMENKLHDRKEHRELKKSFHSSFPCT